MEQGSQERSLPATERKLQKARDDGQVSRSEDLRHLAVLGIGSFTLLTLTPVLFDHLLRTLRKMLAFDAETVRQTSNIVLRLGDATTVGLAGCVAFATIVSLATIAAGIGSGGWVRSLKPITPDFSRVSPLSGLKNMFSKKKLFTVIKMLLMAVLMFAVATGILLSDLQTVAALVLQPSNSAIAFLSKWIATGMGMMLLVVLIAAMVDVPLQSYLHQEQMKMSHQEVKQEGKETDGNPQIKSKIREKQREISQKGSINAVPKADFVVMNPTHFAVAIRYDEKTMGAPQVISKGADLLAMKIRDIAKQHEIPVLQSPMLARALYANAELNQDIPSALYTAVAQVLAYVYRLRAALRGQGPMPTDLPQPFVPPELDPHSKTLKAASV